MAEPNLEVIQKHIFDRIHVTGEEIKNDFPNWLQTVADNRLWEHFLDHQGKPFTNLGDWLVATFPNGCSMGATQHGLTYEDALKLTEGHPVHDLLAKSTPRQYRPINKQIEEDKGSSLASRVIIPARILGGWDAASVAEGYGRLETEEARRSFLDDVRLSMEVELPNGWTRVYIALDLMRREGWYWQGLGYKTFDEYLESECGFPFREFERLEKLYCFAAKCCPQLFKVSKDDIEQVMRAWETAPALHKSAGRPNGDAKSERNDLDPARELVVEAQSEDFQRGYAARGNSRFYRFQRLRRDAPKVAGDVLEGKYTQQHKNGTWFINLVAAEEDAAKRYKNFKLPVKKQRKKSVSARVIALLANATDEEVREVENWIKSQQQQPKRTKQKAR